MLICMPIGEAEWIGCVRASLHWQAELQVSLLSSWTEMRVPIAAD
jgi:hypothetical protein